MLGFATVPAIELAERLAGIAPVMACSDGAKVFYSDAGATAVELALKMAIGFHFHTGQPQRNVFVGLSGAYHGDTTGSFSVGFSETMHRAFRPMTFESAWAPAPDARAFGAPGDAGLWPNEDPGRVSLALSAGLEGLDAVLDRVGDRCAGIIAEPCVQGAAGMIVQPPGYFRELARRARERGVLLIADEVATGIGRTGAMFACDHEEVRADIVCVAKGLSGGYLPLAATVCSGEIARAFEGEIGEGKTLYHGHTFTGNPLGCAAAIATLDVMARDDVVGRAAHSGVLIREALNAALADHPHVGDVRVRGVMAGIELVGSRDPWVSFDSDRRMGARVCEAARERGIIVRPLGDVVVLNPAPAMDVSTLSTLLEWVIEAICTFDFDAAAR